MKTITKKILGFILPVLLILSLFQLFSSYTSADEEYRIVRVCNNGICIVTVYTLEGAIVNVYEELDILP